MGKIIKPRLVALVNRTNRPITISYKGASLIIPAKGSTPKEFILEHLTGINSNELMVR